MKKTPATAGQALRESILAELEMEPLDGPILDMACRTADEIAALESAPGEFDSARLRTLRLHRASLASLLKSLKPPRPPAPRQSGQRKSPAQGWPK